MWQLVINGPGYFDTNYDLLDGMTQLGRADENDIVLSGDLVSRKHARLHVSGDGLIFEDLGSRNGSKVNGDRVTGSVPVKAGDVLFMGENHLFVRQPALSERAATEMIDAAAAAGGSVRRYGQGIDIAQAVMMARDVNEKAMEQVLDGLAPFEHASSPAMNGERGGPFVLDEPLADAGHASHGALSWQSLMLLYRVTARLNSASSLNAFLDETMNWLMKRVGATTGVVLIRTLQGVMMPASVCHAGRLQNGEVPVSDAIVDAALAQGQAIAVGNVHTDSRFSGRESVMAYGVDQVLCIPIGVHSPFMGVMYLNRPAGSDEPIERLLDLCTAIAQLVQTGIAKFQKRPDKDDRFQRALERFHAPDIVERRIEEMKKEGQSLTQLEERQVTVMFADIAGFADVTERLMPDRVTELLNEFYRLATQLIFSFEGTVDTFLGNQVMALFGAPYSRGDDAIRAVRAAMALKAAWDRAMKSRPEHERLKLRLGLNTGKVLAGTVGSEARLDFTAIGEPVNIASWLCSSAEPGQVLVTAKSLAAIGARFDVTALGERPLFGSEARTAIFEVLDEDDDSSTLSGIR